MEEIQNIRYYIENGENHERCDLSDYIFKDIDYTAIKNSISFFRSDFTRSTFQSCTFNRNDFGRADFIDTYFLNTEFYKVSFGSCLIKNSLFEKTLFNKNNYRGVAIQYSNFKKCVFRDEDIITNMYQCEFVECTFINCTFKKSSLDCNAFINCEFVKVDMSECVAENLQFDSCSLRDVFLCSDLWSSYLYKKTDIYNFGFKCRGEVVEIWDGDLQLFLRGLINKKQYFEYLNTLIISSGLHPNVFFQEFSKMISLIINQRPLIRKRTLTKVFDMIKFYFNYEKFPLEDYLKIFDFLSNYEWNTFPFDEEIIYRSKLFEINKLLENFELNIEMLYSVSASSTCLSKIHLAFNKSADAINYLETIFDIVNKQYCGEHYTKPYFRVLSEEKGSIIFTIVSASLLVLLVSYIAKKTMHNIFSIQIEQSIKKEMVKKISASGTDLAELKKLCNLAEKYHFLNSPDDSKAIKDLSDDFAKGEIIDILLNFLF